MGMAERVKGWIGSGLVDKAVKDIKKTQDQKNKALERIARQTNPGAYKNK